MALQTEPDIIIQLNIHFGINLIHVGFLKSGMSTGETNLNSLLVSRLKSEMKL